MSSQDDFGEPRHLVDVINRRVEDELVCPEALVRLDSFLHRLHAGADTVRDHTRDLVAEDAVVVVDLRAARLGVTEREVGDRDQPRRALAPRLPPRVPGRIESAGHHFRRQRGPYVTLPPLRHALEGGRRTRAEQQRYLAGPRRNRRVVAAADGLALPHLPVDLQVTIEPLTAVFRPV